jgi:hypothetical protein
MLTLFQIGLPGEGRKEPTDGEVEIRVQMGGQGREKTRTGAEEVWTDADPRYRYCRVFSTSRVEIPLLRQ